MSAATADRMVRRLRETDRPHGISTTKPGRLLKRQVPVRTFGEWDDLRPGFFEADLVAHCGGSTDGSFLYTLCLTDVAPGGRSACHCRTASRQKSCRRCVRCGGCCRFH